MGKRLCKLERRILQIVVLMEAPDVLLVRREFLLSLHELRLLLNYLGCKLFARLISFRISCWTLLLDLSRLGFFWVRVTCFLQI